MCIRSSDSFATFKSRLKSPFSLLHITSSHSYAVRQRLRFDLRLLALCKYLMIDIDIDTDTDH